MSSMMLVSMMLVSMMQVSMMHVPLRMYPLGAIHILRQPISGVFSPPLPPSSAIVSNWLTPSPPSGGWRNMWTAPYRNVLIRISFNRWQMGQQRMDVLGLKSHIEVAKNLKYKTIKGLWLIGALQKKMLWHLHISLKITMMMSDTIGQKLLDYLALSVHPSWDLPRS